MSPKSIEVPRCFKVDHPPSTQGARESLIVVSDLHLGNDLNEHPIEGRKSQRSRAIDTDFIGMLSHYARGEASAKKTWRLVIAGDFIDFIGMAVLPGGRTVATKPNEEEVENGLGSTEDHARLKLSLVASRHAKVFEALGEFVARGHGLTIVRGNHDIEFHWTGVKDEFRAHVLEAARRNGVSIEDDQAFAQRIEFREWFFYVDGVAYIEHGHQYDALCATDYVMAPMSQGDPRRTARALSDVLLRFIQKRTPNLPETGHDRMGVSDYVRFAVGLGAKGLVQLASRFASAVMELFRLRKEHFTSVASTLREEHERRMELLAEATQLGRERLRALALLQVAPATRSVRGILASVLLDRLAISLGMCIALASVALLGLRHGYTWISLAGILVTWALLQRHFESHRREMFGEHLDPGETLIDKAGRLSHLFPAAFVVMGHTHAPQSIPLPSTNSHYVNLGSWSEEEIDDGSAHGTLRASRTHLVLEPSETGTVASFMRWTHDGPTAFEARPRKGAKASSENEIPAAVSPAPVAQRDS